MLSINATGIIEQPHICSYSTRLVNTEQNKAQHNENSYPHAQEAGDAVPKVASRT